MNKRYVLTLSVIGAVVNGCIKASESELIQARRDYQQICTLLGCNAELKFASDTTIPINRQIEMYKDHTNSFEALRKIRLSRGTQRAESPSQLLHSIAEEGFQKKNDQKRKRKRIHTSHRNWHITPMKTGEMLVVIEQQPSINTTSSNPIQRTQASYFNTVWSAVRRFFFS